MSRQNAISHAERHFDEGGFFADLARRVAIPTESQNPDRAADLSRQRSPVRMKLLALAFSALFAASAAAQDLGPEELVRKVTADVLDTVKSDPRSSRSRAPRGSTA